MKTDARFCWKCSRAWVDVDDKFCQICGADFVANPGLVPRFASTVTYPQKPQFNEVPHSAYGTAKDQTARTGYPISLNRILILTIVSFGFYLIYWFYLTWRDYRDHTGSEAYPIWHALTLFVPIYGLFRIHAHMRSYNELMRKSGLHSGISIGWVVTVALVAGVFDNAALNLSGGLAFDSYTLGAAVASEILFAISLTLVVGLLLHVQSILNRYWAGLENVQIVPSKVRPGEVLCVIIGLLAWSDTLQSLLSASYRGA